MGLLKTIIDELAQRQGFQAGAEGKPPRIFLSDTEHKKKYMDGYEMGQKNSVAHTLDKALDKIIK